MRHTPGKKPVSPEEKPPVPDSDPETSQLLAILDQLGLEPDSTIPTRSSHCLLLPVKGGQGKGFLFKYYLPCPQPWFDQGQELRNDGARRETAFYRFLDVVDRDRCFVNVPRLVMVDSSDHPKWILFEGIEGVRSACDQPLRPDWFQDSLLALRRFPARLTDGRRGLMLERWDPYAHREAIFKMREVVEPKVGKEAWDLIFRTLNEAREWADTADPVLVNGWFQDGTLLLDEMGRIYLHEFRRSGLGSLDIDFGWYWATCTRDQEWKNQVYHNYCAQLGTGNTYRVEWTTRSVVIYVACVRIAEAGPQDDLSSALELLERGILGGSKLFP